MDDIYKRFLKLNLDTGLLGIEKNNNFSPYFCTPENSTVIGSEGVDGIHYCFIDSFPEMVFAVTPMDDMPSYIKPLAYNFKDFLILLLTLGHTAVIEQALMFDKKDFYIFAEENKPSKEAKEVLSKIKEEFNLETMEEPWDYLKEISASFPYDKIPFSKEYYETLGFEEASCPWEVRFGDSIWSTGKEYRSEKDKGREISTNFKFTFEGKKFILPAIYICDEGIVADVFMEFEREDFEEFYDKWSSILNGGEAAEKEDMLARYENPAAFYFNLSFIVNEKEIEENSSSSGIFLGSFRDFSPSKETETALEHYSLDKEKCYSFKRACFKFKKKGRPVIDSLAFTIEEEEREYPLESFTVNGCGDKVEITLPDKRKTTLTVLDYEDKEADIEDEEFIFPNLYTAVSYSLEPEISSRELTVRDLTPSDSPLKREIAHGGNNPTEAAAIAIIGGADGPTAVFISPAAKKNRTAFSSPSFKRKKISWTPIANIKNDKKQTFYLY